MTAVIRAYGRFRLTVRLSVLGPDSVTVTVLYSLTRSSLGIGLRSLWEAQDRKLYVVRNRKDLNPHYIEAAINVQGLSSNATAMGSEKVKSRTGYIANLNGAL